MGKSSRRASDTGPLNIGTISRGLPGEKKKTKNPGWAKRDKRTPPCCVLTNKAPCELGRGSRIMGIYLKQKKKKTLRGSHFANHPFSLARVTVSALVQPGLSGMRFLPILRHIVHLDPAGFPTSNRSEGCRHLITVLLWTIVGIRYEEAHLR